MAQCSSGAVLRSELSDTSQSCSSTAFGHSKPRSLDFPGCVLRWSPRFVYMWCTVQAVRVVHLERAIDRSRRSSPGGPPGGAALSWGDRKDARRLVPHGAPPRESGLRSDPVRVHTCKFVVQRVTVSCVQYRVRFMLVRLRGMYRVVQQEDSLASSRK